MDDDGMIMNFSSTVSSAVKPVAKKGPKNRQSKNKAKPGSNRPASQLTASMIAPIITAAPSKPVAVEAAAVTEPKKGEEEASAVPATMVHGRNQVMSSLFTSNPEINLPKFSKKTTQRSDIPSNAPIADSGNFTGIGIDADLVDLLQKKFNVDTPTNVQRRAIPLLLGPSREVLDAAIPDQDVDVVVQAQTGSGKTLTYLLPIINRLVAASTYNPANSGSVAPFGDRSVGTVAIILAPTRELAQQVTGVLTQLVNLPRPKAEGVRRLHWIVPGMVIGGDSKSKEKARLRKGVNVLVSTPGRLLDHLENTKSFDIQNLKWLVLDEADRLLDLGFEETLKKIMTIIDERTRTQGSEKFKPLMKSKYWPKRRQTVLCSATLREDVKSLAGWLLVKPVFVRGMELESTGDSTEATSDEAMEDIKFTAPNQLKQKYTIIPAKLRLVTLVALLKSCFVSRRNKPLSSKVIVFFSCCDSVDFHYDLLANAGKALEDEDEENEEDLEEDDEDHEQTMMKKTLEKIMGKTDMSKNKQIKKKQPKKDDDLEKKKPFQISTLLGEVPVFRLHGDLEQQVRTETFSEFSKASAGVLLCTDVAARGLDLPNVDRIVQYDPPTDMKDYVHRVGRTARLGKAGEAMLFLLPSEMEYLDIIKAQDLYPDPVTVESILEGLVEKHSKQDFQTAAQELQNNMEQYVLSQEENVVMARKAYWSSVRAYATHSAAEKHIFHVRKLHLGHIAKAFGLREAPSNLHEQSKGQKKRQAKQERTPGQHKFGAKGGEVKKNPMKRKYDQADEFAITSADKLVSGPVTKKKKKLAKK